MREASFSLGKSTFKTLMSVLLPNIKPSVLTALVLTFAHTVGEFGVVLMIGGNIPGETKVASIAIYDEVEMMNYDNANMYAMILFPLHFDIVCGIYIQSQFQESAFHLIQVSLHKTLQSAQGKISLEVECSFTTGSFVTIYGPSGAGKTTLLRMLAGLLKPDDGFIKMGDNIWFDAKQRIDLAPQKEASALCSRTTHCSQT